MENIDIHHDVNILTSSASNKYDIKNLMNMMI